LSATGSGAASRTDRAPTIGIWALAGAVERGVRTAVTWHDHRVNTVTDTSEAPPAPDAVEPPTFRWRRVWLVVSVVVVVAIAVTVLTRPRAATPEQFTVVSQKLSTLSAPGDSFTPYDPILSSYLGSAPEGLWVSIARDTWSEAEDPSWWKAVRGWEMTVPAGQGPAVCSDVLAWLTSTGSALGLTTPGPNENLPACLSALDIVRSDPGNANDSWSGRGTQTGDGQLRNRMGAETFTGTRHGDVVIRVTAEASVANR